MMVLNNTDSLGCFKLQITINLSTISIDFKSREKMWFNKNTDSFTWNIKCHSFSIQSLHTLAPKGECVKLPLFSKGKKLTLSRIRLRNFKFLWRFYLLHFWKTKYLKTTVFVLNLPKFNSADVSSLRATLCRVHNQTIGKKYPLR